MDISSVNIFKINDKSLEIAKDYVTSDKTFTSFNSGAYFEFIGLKNIYIDARPELYAKGTASGKDVLSDYDEFCKLGSVGYSKTDADKWFNSYAFDYVIIDAATDIALHIYMEHRADYKNVPLHNDKFLLYKKQL